MRKRVIATALTLALLAVVLAAGNMQQDNTKEVIIEPIEQRVEIEAVEEAAQIITEMQKEETEAQPEYIPSTQAEEGYISELELIELTEEIGRQYGVCPELLQAMAEKESTLYLLAANGDCKGLMQISEKWHTERMERLGITDIYDARSNITLAADYIAELRDTTEHGSDIIYVLMRYNMATDTANSLYEAGLYTEYAVTILQEAARLERLHGK